MHENKPKLDRHSTVARIVTDHPATARIFQRRGIDYCCHGNVSVPQACAVARVDPDEVFAELDLALAAQGASADPDPRTLSDAALITLVVERHHGYLRRALPYIAPIMAKVAKVHGPRQGGLGRLEEVVRTLAESLVPHLDQEEAVLFPLLLSRTPDPAKVRQELAQMHEEHLAVGDLLAQVRKLTDRFTTPGWGCNTYRVLMAELEALEGDILRHVHLENHVLAPRFGLAFTQAA
ncbi:MAG TPA: iron-sulfur cluster repair di-iron protein [Anaeromyxobacteraceae bacterium]|nr:iron-sulfur cluster repair di-iron protein [Anaeromyxobacteraceae bacterium]